MNRALSLALVLSAFAAGPVAAATWDIDPVHSHVGFKVEHLVVTKVRGNFNTFSGTVMIDDKDITKSKVNVTIDAASIDTRNQKRDDHLRSEDFFFVKKHPQITFTSTRIKKGKGKTLEVFGKLTMRGVTKPVRLVVEGPSPEVKDPGGNLHRGLSATTTLRRQDWGLTWSKTVEGTSVVGDEIEIEIEVELTHKR